MGEKMPYHILLVEDDKVDAELLEEQLVTTENFSYKLDKVENLKSAAEKINDPQNLYDVVLLDLGLKTTTGIETYQNFKAFCHKIPVIIMTGLDDEVIALEAISQGAQDYLVKGKVSAELIVRSISYSVKRFMIEGKLAEKEEQYRNIFESVLDAIIIHDIDGNIFEVNQAAENLYGYSKSEFSQLKIEDVAINDHKEMIHCALCKLQRGNISKVATDDLTREGRLIHTLKLSKTLTWQGKDQIYTLVHDLTEIKKKEKELHDYQNLLEDKVKERTQELEHKYNELERIYKLMIGREFRIKELRDEVKDLKEQIQNQSQK